MEEKLNYKELENLCDKELQDELMKLRSKFGDNFVKGIDEVGNRQGLKSYLEEWIEVYKHSGEENKLNPHVSKTIRNNKIKDLQRYIKIIEIQESRVD
ncbi:hypothetical protein C656_12920 [Enterococcus hirae 57-03-H11]|uniref:hypothetical protein n=1 Tax=Enterococcus TaxID=1350 RepID=UPI0006B1E010|nr:hypothetical protein [Enterococcus hirae]OWW63212.1 hypothetical protein C656_12920 [Enterococcus hirae 57-03-H11]EMF0058802.1 hypothetical protein [Enterococcus hirae]EMF0182608.1 hypothetical protein [Enterococcus hirae]EMF0197862.1 hypothetical protein [Enterococcus hirae]EMF0205394.1 hypothetical protein [Enterococcus hirae]